MLTKSFLPILLYVLLSTLSSTVVGDDRVEATNHVLAGVPIAIYKRADPSDSHPSHKSPHNPTNNLPPAKSSSYCTGVTFFLTGSMIPLSEYLSTIDVLVLERQQWVIGYEINVFEPPVKSNHLIKAHDVNKVYDAFRDKYSVETNGVRGYNVVGHSVGGQIALLLAAAADPKVEMVIALDPVDENPPYFTVDGKHPAEKTLEHTRSDIVMTLTDGGRGISTEHNAQAIHDANPRVTTLVRHKDAGHMAYTDHGGGPYGKLIPGGTPEGNEKAREGAQDLIRRYIKTHSESTMVVA